jgi:hypothetical protein
MNKDKADLRQNANKKVNYVDKAKEVIAHYQTMQTWVVDLINRFNPNYFGQKSRLGEDIIR